jgi:methylenetetrahydrofolate reductase (NADPH)
MLRVFNLDMMDSSRFVVTLELVPGTQPAGRKLETVLEIANDSFKDGRVSAVSITDNPGGSPALGPNALAYQIFQKGMDVIVHFTCRDLNRGGMESRALQLAMLGIKNILALNGDYISSGFGGQGKPVYDLDSVNLVCMLNMLSERNKEIDPDGYFIGCAVSPFKQTEAELMAQYAKMKKKISAGASYLITQLGYDARKFDELIKVQKEMGCSIPTLASLYVLTPGVARKMNQGGIPGCVVTDSLLKQVEFEWTDNETGLKTSIERSAKLAAILKGLGYRGIHIGGIHKSFETASRILDLMEEIEDQWQDFLPEFNFPQANGFYLYPKDVFYNNRTAKRDKTIYTIPLGEKIKFCFLKKMHDIFFNFDSSIAPWLRKVCQWLDKSKFGSFLMHLLEDPLKILLLSCQRCGDCGIQHIAFQCPESGCPKNTRNGACGGSLEGKCEVKPEKQCIWVKAYKRWASINCHDQIFEDFVPPRMWELNHTSSWINFHMKRDHQTPSPEIARCYDPFSCRPEKID